MSSPANLPGTLSTLTQLTYLHLAMGNQIHEFHFFWLSKLTAVKQLSLAFASETMRINLTDQLLSLTHLQFLRIDQLWQTCSPETVLSLEVCWHLMPMTDNNYESRKDYKGRLSAIASLEERRKLLQAETTALSSGTILLLSGRPG